MHYVLVNKCQRCLVLQSWDLRDTDNYITTINPLAGKGSTILGLTIDMTETGLNQI